MPAKTVIQTRRDTAANWASANPTLAAGEWGLETDTGYTKLGTGSAAWNSLGYSAPSMNDLAAVQHNSTSTLDIFDRPAVLSQRTTASGSVYLRYFTPIKNFTASNLVYVSGDTASSGLTLARFGLFTVNASDEVTLVARTASDTTIFNATQTVYTRAFDTTGGYPSSYALRAGVRYAVGFITVGTTAGSISGTAAINLAINNLTPRITGILTSQTDLPTTANTAITTGTNINPWARLT